MFDIQFNNADKREPKGGWATGNYTRKCYTCDELFTGDKRAMTCSDCAYGTKDEK